MSFFTCKTILGWSQNSWCRTKTFWTFGWKRKSHFWTSLKLYVLFFFGTGPNLFWTYRKTGHYLHIKTNIVEFIWEFLTPLHYTVVDIAGMTAESLHRSLLERGGDIIPDNLVKLFVWIRSSIPTNFESISPILGIRLKALRLISIPAICIEVIMFLEFFADSLKLCSLCSFQRIFSKFWLQLPSQNCVFLLLKKIWQTGTCLHSSAWPKQKLWLMLTIVNFRVMY